MRRCRKLVEKSIIITSHDTRSVIFNFVVGKAASDWFPSRTMRTSWLSERYLPFWNYYYDDASRGFQDTHHSTALHWKSWFFHIFPCNWHRCGNPSTPVNPERVFFLPFEAYDCAACRPPPITVYNFMTNISKTFSMIVICVNKIFCADDKYYGMSKKYEFDCRIDFLCFVTVVIIWKVNRCVGGDVKDEMKGKTEIRERIIIWKWCLWMGKK